MDGLTEGRIVHYVLDEGRSKGEHRPAIVVKVWRPGEANYPPEKGVCNLQVFTDFGNDFPKDHDGYGGQVWATSVEFSEDKEPGTWHWIEPA